MTDRFVDNFTPGSGGDGLSWANAELTLAAVDAADVAGDRILFDYRHSESTAGIITLAIAGTNASPSTLLSVTQSGASGYTGPTAGAIVATGAGAYPINASGSFYAYGITFKLGVGSSAACSGAWANGDGNIEVFENCALEIATTHSSTYLQIGVSGATNNSSIRWIDFDVKFAATGQRLLLVGGDFVWSGGAAISGTTTPTNLIDGGGSTYSALIENLDLSNFASTVNLCAGMNFGGRVVFRNIKMPSGWSGVIGTPTVATGRVEAYNVGPAVASGENNFSLWIEDYAGSVKHETTIVRTGGASDGTTAIAHKLSTTANAEWPTIVMRGPGLYAWCNSTGSKTFTVHYVADENVAAGQGAGTSNAFRDDELWIEVEALTTTDSPQAAFTTGMCGVLDTPADNASSSETWTTTGLTTPKKGKLEVTLTVNEKGPYIVRVCGAKASKTIYYCPEVGVS